MVYFDITPLLPHLCSTSNIAIVCVDFNWRVRSNGFPIKTSKGDLSLSNCSFYKYLDYPYLDVWFKKELFRMIGEDNVNELKQFLEQGVDTDVKSKYGYCSALIRAAWNGRTDCVRVLLQYNANIEAKDVDGETALIVATKFGNTECMQLLLQGGVNVEATAIDGTTALIWAARLCKIDFLKILIEHGAKVSPETRAKYPQYAELWEDSTL